MKVLPSGMSRAEPLRKRVEPVLLVHYKESTLKVGSFADDTLTRQAELSH